MDQERVGRLIRTLRKDRNMTQLQLAQELFVTDRAVSKWERGLGCPDVSLLTRIGELFGVDVRSILEGNMEENGKSSGNMKRTKFYVCPICGNIISSSEEAGVTCCSRTLEPLVEKKCQNGSMSVERTEPTELFVSSSHPMDKDNYISFVAYLTSDSMLLKKLYPEWEISFRFPWLGHGKILWYSEKEGLSYTLV